MADTLIREWQKSAMAKECSFCAIEVSEAARSDSELPELLSAHAPHGAHLYIVKRDSNVSGDEIQQLREVLDSLQIQPAWNEPLNVDDSSTWAFHVLAEVKLEERVESADRDRSLEGVRAKQTPEDKEEVLELKARYAGLRAAQDAVRKLLEQKQLQSFEQHTHIQDALLKRSRDIGAGIEEKAPSCRGPSWMHSTGSSSRRIGKGSRAHRAQRPFRGRCRVSTHVWMMKRRAISKAF